jgi:hypothetical protein
MLVAKGINTIARSHYEDSMRWLQAAAQAYEAQDWNRAVTATGISTVCKDLALFAVNNHALLRNIDDQENLDPPPATMGGPKVWA